MNELEFRITLLKHGTDMTVLAKKMGITRNALYNKVKGKSDFYYGEIVKLKEALNLSNDEFSKIFPVWTN